MNRGVFAMRHFNRSMLARAAVLVAGFAAGAAEAQTKIDFFFPVPVEGKLAREMLEEMRSAA